MVVEENPIQQFYSAIQLKILMSNFKSYSFKEWKDHQQQKPWNCNYNKEQRQAKFILFNRDCSPCPAHSAIQHQDKSFQHVSSDKSTQCRGELVRWWPEERMQLQKSPFQAHGLTVLWFPCGAIWTESGLELCCLDQNCTNMI